MIKLNLYYPNQNWRECVGDLVNEDDKKFSWFMCAKKYRGKDGYYLVEIAKKTKFYSIETGDTYVIGDPKTLIIGKEGWVTHPDKYDGYAIENEETCSSDSELLCKEVTFYFKKEALIQTNKIEDEKIPSPYEMCDIISFSKRNYDRIKAKIKNFPSPQEIDHTLKTHKCSIVSKVLYEYLIEFLKF